MIGDLHNKLYPIAACRAVFRPTMSHAVCSRLFYHLFMLADTFPSQVFARFTIVERNVIYNMADVSAIKRGCYAGTVDST